MTMMTTTMAAVNRQLISTDVSRHGSQATNRRVPIAVQGKPCKRPRQAKTGSFSLYERGVVANVAKRSRAERAVRERDGDHLVGGFLHQSTFRTDSRVQLGIALLGTCRLLD